MTPEEAQRILINEQARKVRSMPIENAPLRIVRPYFYGIQKYPREFTPGSPAFLVFSALCICYQKAGNISEGMLGDVTWSFAKAGLPRAITHQGFKQLSSLGFLQFTDALGFVLLGEPKETHYYQWKKPFYDLLLERQEKDAPMTNQEEKKISMEKL